MKSLQKIMPGDFCLLCGGTAEVVAFFVPEDPGTWGAGPGKTKIFRYCLCRTCQARSDTPEKVEKVIKSELCGGIHHENA